MQVKSIAECSKGSILQYFRLSLSYHLSLRSLFCLFFSGPLRQVLLYINEETVLFFVLCCSQLCLGFPCLVLVCTVVLCFLYSLAINLLWKRALIALIMVFLLLHVCLSSSSLGAMGWSVVCDCGISFSYSLALACNPLQ